jgi:hypothetical protein
VLTNLHREIISRRFIVTGHVDLSLDQTKVTERGRGGVSAEEPLVLGEVVVEGIV